MMKLPLLATLFALSFAAPALAQLEDDYSPAEPRATTPWLEWVTGENIEADLHFIKGMRPHHAGALTMSEQYLAHKNASSARLQALARSIIVNQRFEVGVLDRVEELVKAAPKTDTPRLAQVAELGLAQKLKFSHAAIPSLAKGPWAEDRVSKRDVQFAKAMIVHHEGALEMCDDYLADPAAVNGYLELLCLDIKTSQAQEITLMHNIIADYPGDPDKVKITPDMIHGMEHMHHGKKPKQSHKHHHERH